MRADLTQTHAGAHGAGRVLFDATNFLIDGVPDGFRESYAIGLDKNIHE